MPFSALTHGSAVHNGTMGGVGGVTVGPSFSSHLKPSQVDPVSGCDTLPVANTYCVAVYTEAPHCTPLMRPSLESIFVTGEEVLMVTPPVCIYLRSTANTSAARCVCGKARLPASTTDRKPRDSKKVKVSLMPNCAKSEYKYCSALPYALSKTRMFSSALVMLQRPPPEMESFIPNVLFFSSRSTRAPNSAARPAAITPDAPPPTTIRSYITCLGIMILKTFLLKNKGCNFFCNY